MSCEGMSSTKSSTNPILVDYFCKNSWLLTSLTNVQPIKLGQKFEILLISGLVSSSANSLMSTPESAVWFDMPFWGKWGGNMKYGKMETNGVKMGWKWEVLFQLCLPSFNMELKVGNAHLRVLLLLTGSKSRELLREEHCFGALHGRA